MDADGRYTIEPASPSARTSPCGSTRPRIRRISTPSEISGAHRLPNGNTLICAGVRGTFFEVTPAGETVWEYVNPVVHNGILAQGELPGLDHRGHNWNAVFKIHRYPLGLSGPGRQGPEAARPDRAARIDVRQDRLRRSGGEGRPAGRQARESRGVPTTIAATRRPARQRRSPPTWRRAALAQRGAAQAIARRACTATLGTPSLVACITGSAAATNRIRKSTP